MRNKLFTLLILAFLVSCENIKPLYVEKAPLSDAPKTVSAFNEDYFEIELAKMEGGSYSIATKGIEENTSTGLPTAFITIVPDEKSSDPIHFKESTEFLNFMSDHGYEMVEQKEYKLKNTYTFKKKK